MTHRPQKVAAQIRSALARLLVEEVSNPHLQRLAITRVSVSSDLKNAFIYFDSGPVKDEEIKTNIKKAIPFLKRRIGQSAGLRYVPQLNFEKEDRNDSIVRVLSLLDELGPEAAKP